MKTRMIASFLICALLLMLGGCGQPPAVQSSPSPAPSVSPTPVPTPKPTPTPEPTPKVMTDADFPKLLGDLATKEMMEYFLQLFPDGDCKNGMTTAFIRNIIRSNLSTDHVYKWVFDFINSINEGVDGYEYDGTTLSDVLDVFTDKPIQNDPADPNIRVEGDKVIIDGSKGTIMPIQTVEITSAKASDKEIRIEYTVLDINYGTTTHRLAVFTKNASGRYCLSEVSTLPSAVVNSGSCGDNLTWTLDESGLLTISGSGPMKDFFRYGIDFGPDVDPAVLAERMSPWSKFSGEYRKTELPVRKVVVKEGVTSLGIGAFVGCEELTSVEIPLTVTSIGTTAFAGCNQLTTLVIPESVTSLGESIFLSTPLKELVLPANITIIDPNIETIKYAGSWTQWYNATGSPPPDNVIVAINDMPTPSPTPEPTPEPVAQISAKEAYQIARERFDQIKAERGWTFNDAILYSDTPDDFDGPLNYYFSLNIIGLNGMPTKSYANLKVDAQTGECYDINCEF